MRSDTPSSRSLSSTRVISLSSSTGVGTDEEGGEIVPRSEMFRWGRRQASEEDYI